MAMTHTTFATTSRGLRRDILPMGLWEKAKKHGIWNPGDLDFSRDRRDWQGLNEEERDLLLRLTTQFQAGEEAVTLDLLPLIQVIAREGRIEEEMFLTTFLWEEAKHVDFFNRFLGEVVGETTALDRFMTPAYKTMFYELLPEALGALQTDPSPAAQVRASAVYNMVVEGMLAETGYHVYFSILDERNILPGQREGVAKLKRDESRHIAYGVFLISRLMAEDGALFGVFETTMNELLPLATTLVSELFEAYGGAPPFGLKEEDYLNYSTAQFQKRFDRIAKSRGRTLEEIYGATDLFLEDEPAAV